MSGRRGRVLTWAGVALAGLWVLAASAAAGEEALRWRLAKGEKLGYEFSQRNVISIALPNQDVETSNSLIIGFIWEVESVGDDGTARIRHTVDYVRVEIRSPMQGEMVYDTRDPGEPPAGLAMLKDLYGPAIGKPYGLTLDARGTIRDVEVPAAVLEAAKGSPAAAMADGGSLLSAKGVERLLMQVMPPLPEGPATEGTSWDLVMDLPAGPLAMSVTNHYKLEKAGPPESLIAAKIDTEIKPAAGSPLDVEVQSQTGKGSYRFNREKGQLLETDVEQDIRMVLKAMGREIQQHFVIKAELKARDDVK